MTLNTFSKRDVLTYIVSLLKSTATVTELVPALNISNGASDMNHLSSAIDVCDGGDDIITDVRRRAVVSIVVKTHKPSINASDQLCSQIEDAVVNCLITPANQTLNGNVSRFLELSSEALQASDDPLVRAHGIIIKYEVV
jgi:hypothetical protein